MNYSYLQFIPPYSSNEDCPDQGHSTEVLGALTDRPVEHLPWHDILNSNSLPMTFFTNHGGIPVYTIKRHGAQPIVERALQTT